MALSEVDAYLLIFAAPVDVSDDGGWSGLHDFATVFIFLPGSFLLQSNISQRG